MDFEIEDTYCEAFTGTCVRMIVTAEDDITIKKIASDASATPGTVIGRTESGVEKFLDKLNPKMRAKIFGMLVILQEKQLAKARRADYMERMKKL